MTTALPHWEHFSHEADIGIRGIGSTLAEAFEQAALAMTAAVATLDTIKPATEIMLACAAPDAELLLVDWLNQLVYAMATRNMLFSRFAVTLHGQQLQAKAWGESIDVNRHQPATEIKGATYTALSVRQQSDGSWLAQCVVDV